MKKRRFLYLFVDGCGMGDPDPEINPLAGFGTMIPSGLLPDSPFVRGRSWEIENSLLIQVSPLLDTPGLPQSATGQTALFSGIDPCPLIGRHLSGFPTKKLAAVIEEHSLLKRLAQAGFSVTSANAYSRRYFERVERERWLRFSATTLAILAADIPFRMEEDLLAGRAVFHDLSRRLLQKRYPDIPLISPEEAGRQLAQIVMDNDFTLFEYFLTDLTGHRDSEEKKKRVVRELEEFMSGFLRSTEGEEVTLLLISDHGNLEDSTVRTHTRNKVPCLLIGSQSERSSFYRKSPSLEKVYSMVLGWFGISP